ncbi:lipopolysaccharide biosynthesis protein [Lachnotalea glycerini]|uniref:O-antigen/teichoic acid export membrane protein n=1 Tax=Lachnotalea glycerini TaxID=1763509 RepID=A0A371JGA2_9FIRM|nr:oligosaccharide flippase family protein [Lachnotalea glycerini]RDY31717.1 hypothetical protein CG710_008335 [Lachnotalea glycerini]
MTSEFKNMKKQITHLIKGGFFHILIGNTLTKMFAFISSIVIVRLVSKEDFAYLSYADNLYLYVIAISGLGMSSAILKYCGPHVQQDQDKAYLNYAIKFGGIVELVLSALVTIYVWICNIPFQQSRLLVSIMIFYPLLNYIVTTFQSYARAHFDNKVFAKIALMQSFFVLLLSIISIKIIGIFGMVFARYLSLGICCYFGYAYAKSKNYSLSPVILGIKEKREFMNLSFSFMFSSLFSMIMPINETFMINNILKDEILSSNYKVSMLIPSQTMFIANSIAIYFFSVLNNIANKKLLWNKLKKIEILSIGIIGGVSLTGFVLFPYIIKYIYGEKYSDCIGFSNMYWIVYGINSSFRLIALNLIPAIGKAKVAAIISVISAIIHALSCYLIIPRFGIYGAGFVLGLIYLISGFAYWIYIYYCCHFNNDKE